MTVIVEDGSRYLNSYNPHKWSCRKCSGSNFVQWASRRTCVDCLSVRKAKYKANGSTRSADLRRSYGIDLTQYEELLNRQAKRCAICKNPETAFRKSVGKTYALAVDHCHSTTKIRGLLCISCNQGLGCFRDNVELFKAAITYLENNI
jgi:hypothetical protein